MINSEFPQVQLMTTKNDNTQTGILNCQDYLNYSDPGSSQNKPKIQKRYTKQKPEVKQNKDGANAARTARITLVSMVLEQNHKDFIKVLRLVGEDLDIKKIMLNIGEKEFKNRYLLKPELKPFFALAFGKVSEESVQNSIRKNKRSQLNYQYRVDLCYKYICEYRDCFLQKYQTKQVIISIPLEPSQYKQYMKSKGIYQFA